MAELMNIPCFSRYFDKQYVDADEHTKLTLLIYIPGEIDMANNKKRQYFAEVTVPDTVITAQGGAEVDGGKMIKNLLDEYIAADGTKYAKALRDFIFENNRLYG